jgi:restriction system protein
MLRWRPEWRIAFLEARCVAPASPIEIEFLARAHEPCLGTGTMDLYPELLPGCELSVSDYDPFHFSSELIDLLISVIPLLNRSKRGVLTFFRSCGVPDSMMTDLDERVWANSIGKYEIARTLLTRMNDGGDRLLRPRREVVKQVTEFEDFSLCWPDDELKAKGLVSDVRRHVNVKDSFTRMQQAEEAHRLEEARRRRKESDAKQRRRDGLTALRSRLAALSSMPDARQRGLALEAVLNDLFKVDGLSVREAFAIRDDNGQIQEQIDGLIALDNRPILVEAKWHAAPIGQGEISRHLVRLYGRAEVMGLFVSASPYTDAAIAECKTMLSQRLIVLAEINEILMLLEDPEANLADWLRAKITAASVERKPLFYPAPRMQSA